MPAKLRLSPTLFRYGMLVACFRRLYADDHYRMPNHGLKATSGGFPHDAFELDAVGALGEIGVSLIESEQVHLRPTPQGWTWHALTCEAAVPGVDLTSSCGRKIGVYSTPHATFSDGPDLILQEDDHSDTVHYLVHVDPQGSLEFLGHTQGLDLNDPRYTERAKAKNYQRNEHHRPRAIHHEELVPLHSLPDDISRRMETLATRLFFCLTEHAHHLGIDIHFERAFDAGLDALQHDENLKFSFRFWSGFRTAWTMK